MFKMRVHNNIMEALKFNYKRTQWTDSLGYSLIELKLHLELTLPKNMKLEEAMLSSYHLDHKVPQRKFKFKSTSDTDFFRCWSLDNLQMLLGTLNMRKK